MTDQRFDVAILGLRNRSSGFDFDPSVLGAPPQMETAAVPAMA